jgi:hypothetical protein
MNADAALRWLVYLNLAAGTLLIACILWTRLFKVYPFFLAYLLADDAHQVAWIVWGADPSRSQTIYIAGDSLKLILMTFTIREVSRAAFEQYPGLAEFLKRISGYLAAAAAFVSAGFVSLDPSQPWNQSHLLQHFYTLERTIYSTLLSYLLAVSAFMAWFPVRIRRNVAIYIGGFVAFFASHAAQMLLLNRTNRSAAWLGTITLTVSLACVAAWIVGIRAGAKETMTVTGVRWNAGALNQLTLQLEGINASLARFVRTNSK